MNKKMIQGTFWLSAANIITKVLGIVYLIPWLAFMGSIQEQQTAQALYNVAYLPYALFLTLGTAGFPSGIAKKIAELNQQASSLKVRDLFRNSLAVMEMIGIFSAVLMFIFAPVLSFISPVANQAAGTDAIRSLCLSLILIPMLSALRGYFQGMNLIFEFGVSQVIEQFVRVVVIICGTYFLRVVLGQSVLAAVIISTLASAVGGIFAILYLLFVGRRKELFILRDFFVSPLNALKNQRGISLEIIKGALPFVYVGSFISILQLIDQVSLKPILRLLEPALSVEAVQTLFTISSANPNKLTPILLSLVSSITVTSLPLLSILQEKAAVQKEMSNTLKMGVTIFLPAACGMMLLAPQLNTLFFGYSEAGSSYLFWSVVATFLLCLFSILLATLQALNFHRQAMKYVSLAILLKCLLQLPTIYLFAGYGLAFSTIFSVLILFVFVYRYIAKQFEIRLFSYEVVYYRKVLRATILMTISCLVSLYLLNQIFTKDNMLESFIIIGIIGLVGGIIYLLLVFRKRITLTFRNKLNR
ncbi:oligosaccharide flippase family protein [Enterococcus sp. LJL90]